MRSVIRVQLLLSALAVIVSGVAGSAFSHAAERFDPSLQPLGYVAPITLNTSNLEPGPAQAYRPWFESGTWSGDVIEYDIDAEGNAESSVSLVLSNSMSSGGNWSARARFSVQESANPDYWDSGRKIITASAGVGIPFRWGQLNEDQKTALNHNEDLVNYLRGARSLEAPAGPYRRRAGLLGDIIHANLLYVGAPQGNFTFPGYGDYKQTRRQRAPRLYVGANDGMLHALDAHTGQEVFAYIPSMLINKLAHLAEPAYQHDYFVDGVLASGDIYAAGQWHTLLVGGLGAGGKGLFALDVSEANNDDESAAAQRLLWEIDAEQDHDLGYTYSRPLIAKLNDGQWYVIIGNGYNSVNGKALLYIIDAYSGKVKYKIATDGSGKSQNPNGLSSPALVDTNHDFLVDIAYAGDINGNVWKFDLKTLSPGSLLLQSAGQHHTPILTPPVITPHPQGGYLVYFGTGRLLTEYDLASDDIQSLYALWDQGQTISTDQLLLLQHQTLKINEDTQVRLGSDSVPSWQGLQPHRGWRLDLPPGERLLTPLQLRAKRLQAITSNPTTALGENWLWQLDYLTGNAPAQPVIDINQDGQLNTLDLVDGNHDGDLSDGADHPLALSLHPGLMSQPSLARLSAGRDSLYVNGILPIDLCMDDCPGLRGGHLDVTTDSLYGGSNTNHHPEPALLSCHSQNGGIAAAQDGYGGCTAGYLHRYDKAYNRTTLDLFKLEPVAPGSLDNVNQVYIAAGTPLAPQREFILLVANADLSPAARLTLGQHSYDIKDYQNTIVAALTARHWEAIPSYTLQQLKLAAHFELSFDPDAILSGGLHGTAPECVRSYAEPSSGAWVSPSSNTHLSQGRWRNGALTIQLIDKKILTTHPQWLEIQPTPHSGAYLKLDPAAAQYFIYEVTAFWHYPIKRPLGPLCYGAPAWPEAIATARLAATLNLEYARLQSIKLSAADQDTLLAQNAKVQDLVAAYTAQQQKYVSLSGEGATQFSVFTSDNASLISQKQHLISLDHLYSSTSPGPGRGAGRYSWVELTR